MDPTAFDALVRTFTTRGTRRRLVALLTALPLGGLLTDLAQDDAGAERPIDRVQGRTPQRNRQQRNTNQNNNNNNKGGGGGGGRTAPPNTSLRAGPPCTCGSDRVCCADGVDYCCAPGQRCCDGTTCCGPAPDTFCCGSECCGPPATFCCDGQCCGPPATQCVNGNCS
jgi:hypothetical protein